MSQTLKISAFLIVIALATSAPSFVDAKQTHYQTNADIKCFVFPSVISNTDNRWNAFRKKIIITSARNEYENIQIACWPEKNFNNVKFSFRLESNAPTKLPNSNANSNIKIQFRKLSKFDKWDDALVPFDSLNLKAGHKTVVWMTIYIGKNVKPNSYTGIIDILYNNRKIEIPITLIVWEFTIPETPSIPAAFGIFDNHLREYYINIKPNTKQWRQLLADWYALICQYRISPFFCHWQRWGYVITYPSPWKITATESIKYLVNSKIARFPVPYIDENQFKKDIAYIKKKHLLNKAYVYFLDEPDRMKFFISAQKIASEILKIEPQTKILATFYCGPKDPPYNGDIFSIIKILRGYIQIYCLSEWSTYGQKGERFRKLLKPDEEYWLYTCNAPTSPHPNLHMTMTGYQHRAIMWRIWKQQAQGFFYWAVNSWAIEKNKNSVKIKLRKNLPPGDGLQAYPGELFATNKPVASVRLERFRDGMEDYEYIRTLEKKYSRKKAQQIMNMIYISPEQFTHNYTDIEKFRNKIITYIKQANKK